MPPVISVVCDDDKWEFAFRKNTDDALDQAAAKLLNELLYVFMTRKYDCLPHELTKGEASETASQINHLTNSIHHAVAKVYRLLSWD
jgi:hypothetical protein